MTTVFIALGTNLGRRADNLRKARSLLAEHLQIEAESRVLETPPWGYTDQPDFLNQVIRVETDLSPLALIALLKEIEMEMGRAASFRFGPRLIDLDILYYGSLILESPSLTIPHPRMPERRFVLEPLSEIAPDLRHPLYGQSTLELLARLDGAH